MFHCLRARATALQERAKQGRIAVVNFACLKFLAWIHQLVAGGNDCRSYFAANDYIGKGMSGGRIIVLPADAGRARLAGEAD